MDRQDITLVSLWVHVPFIMTWIALVMFDGFAAFAPAFNGAQRARLITWSRVFVLVAIPVIMLTGIWQTIENPFFRVDAYSKLSELRDRTLYGDLLFWKHGFVLVTFGLTVIVRFILAPRLLTSETVAAGSVVSGPGAMAAVSDGGMNNGALRLIQLATVLNLLACLGAVLLATRMVVELH
jgi:hypothetical protein